MNKYRRCPCGSGKNFKWCCQPIFDDVERAQKLHAQGQVENALTLIQQVVNKNPKNAAVLGYQAEILFASEKREEADETLQKAFALNPDFPMGHYLRGMIRRSEGETKGALIQFRKAADLYDPESTTYLADIYASIVDIEMQLNRPVAARAALERALVCEPGAQQLKDAFTNLFGEESRIPDAAAKAYSFRSPTEARTQAWQATLPSGNIVRLTEALAAFEKLVALDAQDAAAWFNIGLVRAWLGDNPRAIEALYQSIELEADLALAAEAGALIEALKCGDGMIEQSDYQGHRVLFQVRQPQAIQKLIEFWQQKKQLSGGQIDREQGLLTAVVLQETSQFTIDGTGTLVAKLAAHLLVVGGEIHLWNVNPEALELAVNDVLKAIGTEVSPPRRDIRTPQFMELALEAVLIPTQDAKIEDVIGKMQEHSQNFYEEIWIHRPLKSLSGLTPLDASSLPANQKKLLGIIQFLEDCFIAISPRVSSNEQVQIIVAYDFDRLRRKLNLPTNNPEQAVAAASAIDAMSVPELAALDVEPLTDEQLDQAFRGSLKLDAPELAGKFARLLADRPAGSLPDRFAHFHHLVQLALAENNNTEVDSLLERGARTDAEANEGKRRNDYAVRQGQILAKRGEVDQAFQVFQELLGRAGDELKWFGPAIETMLSQKRGPWATQFADHGLAKARAQNNRDLEQYFLELAEAARRLG